MTRNAIILSTIIGVLLVGGIGYAIWSMPQKHQLHHKRKMVEACEAMKPSYEKFISDKLNLECAGGFSANNCHQKKHHRQILWTKR